MKRLNRRKLTEDWRCLVAIEPRLAELEAEARAYAKLDRIKRQLLRYPNLPPEVRKWASYECARLGTEMKALGFDSGQRGDNRWWAWLGLRWKIDKPTENEPKQPSNHSQTSQGSQGFPNKCVTKDEKLFQQPCEPCEPCATEQTGCQ